MTTVAHNAPPAREHAERAVETYKQFVAARVGAQAINLPSGHRLKREQIDYICRSIREILGDGKHQAEARP